MAKKPDIAVETYSDQTDKWTIRKIYSDTGSAVRLRNQLDEKGAITRITVLTPKEASSLKVGSHHDSVWNIIDSWHRGGRR
jgi:hypothetical protein